MMTPRVRLQRRQSPMAQSPRSRYRSLELKNVAAGDVDFATEDEKKAAEEATKDNEDLFKAMKDALGEKVTKLDGVRAPD